MSSSTSGLPWRRALAEFMVIVTGVLVALAVDDWRQAQADRALERHLLETMLVDAEESKEDLLEAVRSADARAWAVAELLVALGQEVPEGVPASDVDVMSLPLPIPPRAGQDVQNWLLLAGYAQIFDLRKSAYDQMLSSGTLSIIRNEELRNEVVRYHNRMIDFQESNNFVREDGRNFNDGLFSIGVAHGDWLPGDEILRRLGSSQRMLALLRRQYVRAIEQRDLYPIMIRDGINPFMARIQQALDGS